MAEGTENKPRGEPPFACCEVALSPGMEHCRLFSQHRRPQHVRGLCVTGDPGLSKPPGQIEFGPTRTGAEHRRATAPEART
jgi:hypothetical protein